MIKNIMTGCVIIISLSGCATAINGTNDEINISSLQERNMKCQLVSNNKVQKEWIQNKDIETITVPRESEDLLLKCKDDKNELTYNIESSLDGQFIALNFLIDFCLISCPIDLVSGALYNYPEQIILKN